MKVYIRHEQDADGHLVGEVAPDRILDAFDKVKAASVYLEGGEYAKHFSHQIYYSSDDARFEIVIHDSDE